MQYNSYEKKQCGKIQTTRPASNTFATNSSIAYMPVVLISDKSYDLFFSFWLVYNSDRSGGLQLQIKFSCTCCGLNIWTHLYPTCILQANSFIKMHVSVWAKHSQTLKIWPKCYNSTANSKNSVLIMNSPLNAMTVLF